MTAVVGGDSPDAGDAGHDTSIDGRIRTWIADLDARHRRAEDLSTREFLKAVRALSARYVERRAALPTRSPLDSRARRSAFAAFYAPLHLLTAHHIATTLGLGGSHVNDLLDLGCGTGATGTAVALACATSPVVHGIDRDSWVLDEARRTWRHFGVDARGRRADLARAVTGEPRPRRSAGPLLRRMIVAGWSINELAPGECRQLLAHLASPALASAALLVIEPLSHRVAPWWDEWVEMLVPTGGRTDEWRIETPLPSPLGEWHEAAGFRQDGLTARSLYRPAAS